MEFEHRPPAQAEPIAERPNESVERREDPETPPARDVGWVFLGPNGLRAGWSIAIFAVFFFCFLAFLDSVFIGARLIVLRGGFAPKTAMFEELALFLAMLGAGTMAATIERKSMLDYNLRGTRRLSGFMVGFMTGAAAGFAVLSALVGALRWGGWLHFGPIALSGQDVFVYAVLWALVFLLVGLFEEGTMRCYLLATLTRGVNLWWAAALVAGTCVYTYWTVAGDQVWGVYVCAALGAAPCAVLHALKRPDAAFWQAAWVTSTFFAFSHTSNRGETWVGILAVGAIGFVWCVSVRVTGSAWWAIGCHAAWDWGETYFYGTADSGLAPKGHYLTSWPVGPAIWSGGADGPEGSLLVLAAILLLLGVILALRRRPRASEAHEPALERAS